MNKEVSTYIRNETDKALKVLSEIQWPSPPPSGWIHTLRTALGMSMRQLSERIGHVPSSIAHFEKAEAQGSITLESLRKLADAMDMELVYGFKPKAGSLESTREKQSLKKAKEMLNRSNRTMQLEAQETDAAFNEQELQRIQKMFLEEKPSKLWD
jgi:predicted DNA-binding mobile mystery protein A